MTNDDHDYDYDYDYEHEHDAWRGRLRAPWEPGTFPGTIVSAVAGERPAKGSRESRRGVC